MTAFHRRGPARCSRATAVGTRSSRTPSPRPSRRSTTACSPISRSSTCSNSRCTCWPTGGGRDGVAQGSGRDGVAQGSGRDGVAQSGRDGVAQGSELIGIGIDAVEIDRFRRVLARTPGVARRLFTEGERAYGGRFKDPAPRLAARFAAKEAALKALGVGLGAFAFHHVGVGGGPR